MPIELIDFKGNNYPRFQSEGFAAQFAFPFAKKLCIGMGYDIGCNRPEWAFPGAIPIDPALPGCGFDAYNLPPLSADYIFSSHCLEHLPDWVKAIEYWHSKLKPGGVLFMYLPDMDSQVYWRNWHNRKHIHYINPNILTNYFEDNEEKWSPRMIAGTDLNASFYAVAGKR